MEKKPYFAEFGGRFVTEKAADGNAFALQSGAWKFDYDKLSIGEIRDQFTNRDGRPRFCAETFPDFANLRILELGPSDGYNTASLEVQGATDITSIEGNAGAFMRCLIMKNAFNLKAKFLLGDFLAYMAEPETRFDLVYASGVLYHLLDPIAFLERCSEIAPYLFLWTFHYDPKVIAEHKYERLWFKATENETKMWRGRAFTYHRRYYEMSIVEGAKYAGGLTHYSHWLTKDDLLAVLDMLGFRVLRTIADGFQNIPAINILASRT